MDFPTLKTAQSQKVFAFSSHQRKIVHYVKNLTSEYYYTSHLEFVHRFFAKDSSIYRGYQKTRWSKKLFIRFSIDNLIANISLYALSWPKLNFGSFEIIFKL